MGGNASRHQSEARGGHGHERAATAKAGHSGGAGASGRDATAAAGRRPAVDQQPDAPVDVDEDLLKRIRSAKSNWAPHSAEFCMDENPRAVVYAFANGEARIHTVRSAKRFISALRAVSKESSHLGVSHALSSTSKLQLAKCFRQVKRLMNCFENRAEAAAVLIAPLIEAILPKALPLGAANQQEVVENVLSSVMLFLPMPWIYGVVLDEFFTIHVVSGLAENALADMSDRTAREGALRLIRWGIQKYGDECLPLLQSAAVEVFLTQVEAFVTNLPSAMTEIEEEMPLPHTSWQHPYTDDPAVAAAGLSRSATPNKRRPTHTAHHSVPTACAPPPRLAPTGHDRGPETLGYHATADGRRTAVDQQPDAFVDVAKQCPQVHNLSPSERVPHSAAICMNESPGAVVYAFVNGEAQILNVQSAERFISALRAVSMESGYDGSLRLLSSASKQPLALCLWQFTRLMVCFANPSDACAVLIAPLIEVILPKRSHLPMSIVLASVPEHGEVFLTRGRLFHNSLLWPGDAVLDEFFTKQVVTGLAENAVANMSDCTAREGALRLIAWGMDHYHEESLPIIESAVVKQFLEQVGPFLTKRQPATAEDKKDVPPPQSSEQSADTDKAPVATAATALPPHDHRPKQAAVPSLQPARSNSGSGGVNMANIHEQLESQGSTSAVVRQGSPTAQKPPQQQLQKTVCPGSAKCSEEAPRPASAKPARVDGINARHAAALPGQTPHRGGNDPVSFQQINVDPVLAEILPSSWEPFLPKQDGSDGFLQGRDVKRGVDRAFRLYRADCILQMRLAARTVAEPGFSMHDAPPNSPAIFPNASMRMLYTKRQLPQVIMDFDCPKFLQRLSFEDRESFWKESKWLLPGAVLMVCARKLLGSGVPQLCKRGQPVALLKVVTSIPGILAHQSGRGRASATVKFLDANGWALAPQLVAQRRAVRHATAAQQTSEAGDVPPLHAANTWPHEECEGEGRDAGFDWSLAAKLAATGCAVEGNAAANGASGEFVVVQIGASFAFAGHVLRALQDRSLIAGNTNAPFADKLFAKDHCTGDSKVRMPQWQACPTVRKWMHPQLGMMDSAQREAWKHSLSSRLALVQGPPGTGKTTTGVAMVRALLADPDCVVLVCTHSNQAVDNFLERLLESGLTSDTVLRLGGFSGSRRIQELTVPQLSSAGRHKRSRTESKAQRSARSGLRQQIEASKKRIHSLWGALVQTEWEHLHLVPLAAVKDRIMMCEGAVALASLQPQEVQDQRADKRLHERVPPGRRPPRRLSCDEIFRAWLLGRSAQCAVDTPGSAQRVFNCKIWTYTKEKRQQLARKWCAEARSELAGQLCTEWEQMEAMMREMLDRQDEEVVHDIFSERRVIGCTTSGAAKFRGKLERAGVTVLVMEEAAQMVEAHALAAMPSTLKRMIMVGDHTQLRPSIGTNDLQEEAGKGFSHNVSLFERLAGEGAPMHSLQQQHRMRPEIAEPVKCLSYPSLCNGPGTEGRAPLLGIDTANGAHGSAFLLAHRWPEQQEQPSSDSSVLSEASITNEQEAWLVVAVVQWLLQQGYLLSEVAVLTPYLGQKRLLRRLMHTAGVACLADDEPLEDQPVNAEGQPQTEPEVCVATVDSFQGKECRVVVGSLVRSNASGQLGFLSAAERVHVLLSRARDGLILVGNPFTLLGHKGAVEECSDAPQQLRYDAAAAAALQQLNAGSKKKKKVSRAESTWATVLGRGRLPIVTGVAVRRQCSKHPMKTTLQTPADFANHPRLGKCSFLCKAKMPCGHKCKRPCHSGGHECSLC